MTVTSSIPFITRNEKGNLQQNLAHWDLFKSELLNMAKDKGELEFIGQLIEDLQFSYDDKLESFENQEDEED